jgi:hypothetical protein
VTDGGTISHTDGLQTDLACATGARPFQQHLISGLVFHDV